MAAARTIAIGDIHGCSVALKELLRAVDVQPTDQFILLGDYIDRGPDPRGALDLVMELRRKCRLVPIMGNHEKLLLEVVGGKPQVYENWLGLGGGATLRSFRCPTPDHIPEHYLAFMRSCCRSYETPGHILVHANYLPNLPLEAQPSYALRWESLRRRIPGPHYSGKPVILGHTTQKTGEVLDLGHLICLDTYCYGGGWLTAMDLDSREIWRSNQEGTVQHRKCSNGHRPAMA